MNKIELLLAYEDGTWETEIVDCPKEVDHDSLDSVQSWITKELYGQVQYRKVILISVYNTGPQSEFIRAMNLKLGETVVITGCDKRAIGVIERMTKQRDGFSLTYHVRVRDGDAKETDKEDN